MEIRTAAARDIPQLLPLVRRYREFEGLEGFSVARLTPVLDELIHEPRLGSVWVAYRSANDLRRDAIDHPADVLRLAGIRPGMRVADLLAANGYYSELLSYVVGPKGSS
jgi:hypothetical protein